MNQPDKSDACCITTAYASKVVKSEVLSIDSFAEKSATFIGKT